MLGAASVAAVLRPRGRTSKGGAAAAGGAGGGEEFVHQHDCATLQHTVSSVRPVRMYRDLDGNKSGAAFLKLKLNLGRGRTESPIIQL